MKPKLMLGIIVLMVIINFMLLYKNHNLKKIINDNIDIKKNPPLQIDSVPDFVLHDLRGIRYSSGELLVNASFTLFIFFSLSDCPSCLEENELWNRIFEDKKVSLIGIANHIDDQELIDWVKNSEINFLVLNDIESKVTKMFGVTETPVKILTDDTGQILLVDRVRTTNESQEEFLIELDKFLTY